MHAIFKFWLFYIILIFALFFGLAGCGHTAPMTGSYYDGEKVVYTPPEPERSPIEIVTSLVTKHKALDYLKEFY